jgi:hypothetical protein
LLVSLRLDQGVKWLEYTVEAADGQGERGMNGHTSQCHPNRKISCPTPIPKKKRVKLMAMTMRPVNSKFSKQNSHLSLLKSQISLPDTDAAPDNAPAVSQAHISLKHPGKAPKVVALHNIGTRLAIADLHM